MGSLAGLFAEAGYSVSGSDAAAYPPMSVRLAEQGIRVYEGYDADRLIEPPDLVIVGNACTPTHLEAAFVREHGLVQASFPEALAHYFIGERRSIVVAGTHGKTTTTSMLAHVFRTAGREPGFLVGGIMNDGNSSVSVGSGDYFIVEGDEYDSAYFDKRPKFLLYKPRSAVLTSVEFDHADIYRDWDEYVSAFREFVGLLPAEGLLALCADDPVTRELASATRARIAWYGSGEGTFTANGLVSTGDGQSFTLMRDGSEVARISLQMSGRHNMLNALAVCAISLDEGIEPEVLVRGLASFSGIRRRQQILGEAGGVTVMDDFAHHPTAVRATLQAVSERFPGRRILAIFEPRSNSSRRKVFEEGYTDALANADLVFLSAPIFRHNDDRSNFMDVENVVRKLEAGGIPALALQGADLLLPEILKAVRPGDVAVVMSNGGFGDIHRRILQDLQN